MNRIRTVSLVVALAATSAFAAGCSGAETSPRTSESASAMTKAPVAQGAHGPVKLVGEALGEVPLRNDQRSAIETLAADADARHVAAAKQGSEIATAFADQVEKGAIDRAALKPLFERAEAAMKDLRAKDGADLEKLHALLDADQRDAFADALEDKMHAARKDRGGAGHRGGFGKLKELADAMQLTDDQRDKIKDVMKSAHAARAGGPDGQQAEERGADHGPRGWKGRRGGHGGPGGGKHLLEAFRGPDFKAGAMTGPKDGREGAHHPRMEGMLDTAEKILPLLTPEQRKIAADKLRAAATSGELPFAH